jgi:hypothetical protein
MRPHCRAERASLHRERKITRRPPTLPKDRSFVESDPVLSFSSSKEKKISRWREQSRIGLNVCYPSESEDLRWPAVGRIAWLDVRPAMVIHVFPTPAGIFVKARAKLGGNDVEPVVCSLVYKHAPPLPIFTR